METGEMVSMNQDQNKYITYGQMNLINDFRELWSELIVWFRSFMVSTVTGFGNINSINNQLYGIPEKLKEKLQPFLGVEWAEQAQQLFLMYIVQAQNVITAIINKDQQAGDAAAVALYGVADELADFLARINPYWNKGQWQNLMYQLNEMGIAETMAMVSGDYDTEINIRSRLLKHALLLGDYMASGVMYYLSPEININLCCDE